MDREALPEEYPPDNPEHFEGEQEEDENENEGPPMVLNTVRLVKFKGKYPNPGPRLVRQEFERLGFQFTPLSTPNEFCAALWTMHMDKEEIKQLRPNQTVNWFPAMPEICIKDLLHKNLYNMQCRFPNEFPFWPEGYEMPAKWETFKQIFVDENGNKKFIPFIMKPARNACGKGIRCITHPDELQSEKDQEWLKKDNPLAQRYISSPQLIDGFKISFRIYVVVTSWDPLRLYIYPEGLVRICSEKYTEELSSFTSVYTHVTNIAINKDRVHEFCSTLDPNLPNEGLRLLWTYMLKRWESEGKDVRKLWEEIKDASIKTFISAEKIIQAYVTRTIPFRSNCYELVGFDYLVDQNMKPWLLEVNHAPDLEPYCSLETNVKRAVIRDLLQLVDVESKDSALRSRLMDRILKFLEKMSDPADSVYKSPYTGTTFDRANLSKGDIYTLIDTELESIRAGKWERLFPLADSEKYFKYQTFKNKDQLITRYLQLGRMIQDVFEFPGYYSKQH